MKVSIRVVIQSILRKIYLKNEFGGRSPGIGRRKFLLWKDEAFILSNKIMIVRIKFDGLF